MSETMKMEEGEFFEIMEAHHRGDSREGNWFRDLAARLGIELTPREEEPLPCPWCGGEAVVSTSWCYCKNDVCGGIGPTVKQGSRAEIVAAWNRRHQPPPPTIPTREELANKIRETYWRDHGEVELSRHLGRGDSRWRDAADAAFRAFGLEPRKEETDGT